MRAWKVPVVGQDRTGCDGVARVYTRGLGVVRRAVLAGGVLIARCW